MGVAFIMGATANQAWQKFQKEKNPNFNDGQKVWTLLMPELWKRSLILKNSIK